MLKAGDYVLLKNMNLPTPSSSSASVQEYWGINCKTLYKVSCRGNYGWPSIIAKCPCIAVCNSDAGYIPESYFELFDPERHSWCVPCSADPQKTPELLEWRNYCACGDPGVIDDRRRLWRLGNPGCMQLTYEQFLEAVYKPWKEPKSQPVKDIYASQGLWEQVVPIPFCPTRDNLVTPLATDRAPLLPKAPKPLLFDSSTESPELHSIPFPKLK